MGDLFRSLWGKQAGWAHSVLFAADLRTFAERLSTKLEVTEIKEEGNAKILPSDLGIVRVKTEDAELEFANITKEEGLGVSLDTITVASVLTNAGLKRETTEEKNVVTIQEVSTARKAKRRRKA